MVIRKQADEKVELLLRRHKCNNRKQSTVVKVFAKGILEQGALVHLRGPWPLKETKQKINSWEAQNGK